jgi:hypothetical protein
VVLALLDGFVNDLGERGFFADGVNLSAWDSIAAHDSGLAQLARIFQQGRRKTRAEQITVPYRHGILHGMDLGYDNQIVAAKCWAALFTAGDWAWKIERGQKEAPRPGSETTLLEAFQRLREVQVDRSLIEAWQPRDIKVGRDVPESADAGEYPEGTPERRLVEFLELWKARNFGGMTGYVWMNDRRQQSTGKLAGEMREIYAGKPLLSYRLREVADEANAITVVKSLCAIGQGGTEQPIEFRMLYEDEHGRSVVRGKPGGMWNIVNWVRV